MQTLVSLLCQVLVIFLIFEGALAQNATGELEECIDTDTNKTYKVGESWTIPGQCLKYICNKLPVPGLPNISIPSVVKYVCSDPQPPDNDFRNCHVTVPYPNEYFPKCCPHMVCNRPGYQQVIKPQYQ